MPTSSVKTEQTAKVVSTGSRAAQKAQSRERLLQAGYELLASSAGETVTEHLKVAELTERATLATGSFYVHWESLEQFHREVLIYSLHHDRFLTAREATVGLLREALDAGVSFGDLVRAGVTANVEAVLASPSFKIFVAAWNRGRRDRDLADELAANYREVNAAYVVVYQEIFDRFGYRFRDPTMTMERLAVMLTAIIEGSALRGAVDVELSEPAAAMASDMVLAFLDGLAEGGINQDDVPLPR